MSCKHKMYPSENFSSRPNTLYIHLHTILAAGILETRMLPEEKHNSCAPNQTVGRKSLLSIHIYRLKWKGEEWGGRAEGCDTKKHLGAALGNCCNTCIMISKSCLYYRRKTNIGREWQVNFSERNDNSLMQVLYNLNVIMLKVYILYIFS